MTLVLVHSQARAARSTRRPPRLALVPPPAPAATRWWCARCPAELFTADDVGATLPGHRWLCLDCTEMEHR